MLQIKVPFLPMSAWLPKVVEPSKQQVLAAVFFLILYPYYLIRAIGPVYNEKFDLKLMYWYVVDIFNFLSSDITVTSFSDVSGYLLSILFPQQSASGF